MKTSNPIFLHQSEWDYFEARGVDMRPFRLIQPIPRNVHDVAPEAEEITPKS